MTIRIKLQRMQTTTDVANDERNVIWTHEYRFVTEIQEGRFSIRAYYVFECSVCRVIYSQVSETVMMQKGYENK